MHFAGAGVDLIRLVTGGFVVGGIVRQFERTELKSFVEQLLANQVEDASVRAEIRSRLRMGHTDWGLPLKATHKVFVIDTANTPLWHWHEEGFIDLYALAGVPSFSSFQVQRPRTWVRWVSDPNNPQNESSLPVNRSMISNYLASQGGSHRLRVYAMSPQALEEKLDVATDKWAKIGVRLQWNWGKNFRAFEGSIPVQEITSKSEYRFDIDALGEYVAQKALRRGVTGEECELLALGGFHYALTPDPTDPTTAGHEGFGRTAGRDLMEPPDFTGIGCHQPSRSDSCCAMIDVQAGKSGSGVIHRDVWPDYAFRYVLAHEIGHYLGLCHYGHDGLQNIMFQLQANSPLSFGLFKYYYQSEPEFTLEDGKNSWRFIVAEMACCLSDKLNCNVPHNSIATQAVEDRSVSDLHGAVA